MEQLFEHNERLFQNNEWSDRLHKGMERNDRFNTTERNDRFNTTEWNRTIVLTGRNGTDRSFSHNGTEGNGNGTATAVPLHRINMGTFY